MNDKLTLYDSTEIMDLVQNGLKLSTFYKPTRHIMVEVNSFYNNKGLWAIVNSGFNKRYLDWRNSMSKNRCYER